MARLFRPIDPLAQQRFLALCERSLTSEQLLVGTPGSVQRRIGTGYAYWYRVYYPVPGKQAEALIGREEDIAALTVMRERMKAAEITARQIANLRPFGYLIGGKIAARILVELHNAGVLQRGVIVSGPLAVAGWLNAWGIRPSGAPPKPDRQAPALSLIDVDPPALATLSWLFSNNSQRLASVELSGLSEVTIRLGAPESNRRLAAASPKLLLVGNHAISAAIRDVGSLIWETLASMTPDTLAGARSCLALAAVAVERDPWALLTAWDHLPETDRASVRPLRERLVAQAVDHPELADLFRDCLS